ncbi:MAG TPA: sulfotransferase [Steroidobacteraceae bacterium]|nr:sulfotransferase [Steroidobacteraceae bacterium]
MKLPVSFIQLPLSFDATRLAAEVATVDPACWRPHPQGFAGNDALPLLSLDGDPTNERVDGRMAPTPHLLQMPYLRQVLASLDTVLGRCRLMRLSGHAEVNSHIDMDYYWRERVRVHVPIVTQPTVRFYCGSDETHMGVGECWIFDAWRRHRVVNDAVESRIHLVADTVGTQSFWDLVAAGRSHDRIDPNWRARRVEFDPHQDPTLVMEAVNIPTVMSPWEMRAHLAALFAEAEPSPQLQRLGQATNRFVTAWRALWAVHGESDAGEPEYRDAIDRYHAQLVQLGTGVVIKNGAPLIKTIESGVLKPAIASTQSKGDPETRETEDAPASATEAAVPSVHRQPLPKRSSAGRDAQFDRPIVIVCPPRSGSTLLFETLAQAPGVFTVGGESHRLIEGVPALRPEAHGFESNRLTAADATPASMGEVRGRFLAAVMDREGRRPTQLPLRLLEKTPKNSLRVPFLARAFPEARFVFLYRDPREVMSSMIEAWQSGRFRTYPQLPGWSGLQWSLVLVPGWRELIGKPLHEIVAHQWAATTRVLLDDLAALPAERRLLTRYDTFLADPQAEVRRLCGELALDWDVTLAGDLPLSRFTVSTPAQDKWRRHEREIESVLPALQPLLERSAKFAAH